MTDFLRYAVYWCPPAGSGLARFGAGWLGWDIETGQTAPHPDLGPLPRPVAEITQTPRHYGLHATLKAPFRLAPGATRAALATALDDLAGQLAPVTLPGLRLARMGGFVALVPEAEHAPALQALAGAVVRELDPLRAALTEAEIARRAPERLTAPEHANLLRWGYPYVFDHFRFHVTLSGSLPLTEAEALRSALTPHLAPLLPRPFPLTELCLCGEDAAGRFHLIRRAALRG
ncbi:phosphonate metabolism protein [Rhodobacter veldkampii DSM 11550]|uniref:Phosphonate metabolism protein n=1 Tax=Phaeovulum veldkampii DSM 11550 TaxID=1185920 RepID=A0A2T4JHC7_9RHOB|nr:DUF1045 domain-containing protein [Phaeovulum veldkampii]MBK5945566.1 phosphonate metabolism protein [Phaeovulum veldkampii DSM 11550]PTE17325.1 phosphonate metabolism protein [Phaeovulum veldkampii DSM 11550]TDQ56328.1 putative phosphonate metabolism protein [Phaeovulum veldkampii DSM 11550]